MEKIAIQFNGFEYQVYYDYCLRYYTILDVARKRAIHLFLELFEKKLLTVGEHDLGEAVLFFSKKCEDILAVDSSREKDKIPKDLPLLKICREVPFLIEDFEKLYRIIEKSGMTANYLLLLAMFAKIVEDERNAFVSAIDDNDRRKAELIAPRIAKTIQVRLGPDAGWESVLYELTRIVRKYNLIAPALKIDQNCIYLIGPAVVSHFNVEIGYVEIQKTLERYIEERELAAFEALLNNKQYLPDLDTDTDVSDNLIFEVLKTISGGNIDPVYFETESDPGLHERTGLPAVILQQGISQKYGIVPLSVSAPPEYPVKIPKINPSRFAIDIGNYSESMVVFPEKKIEAPATGYPQQRIAQYSMVFMGAVIIILLAITMAATYGLLNPVTTSIGFNNSAELTSILSIVENLQKNSTIAAKNDQTVSLRAPPVNTIVTVTPVPTKKGITSADINKHFFAAAFGPDNSKIQKRIPEQTLLSMAITGNYNKDDIAVLDTFRSQFNERSSTDKFGSEIKFGEQASIVVVFSPGSTLGNIEKLDGMVFSRDLETGKIRYIHKTVKTDRISKEMVYVNSDFGGPQRTHWTLRAVLDDLGFPGESCEHMDSIFCSGNQSVTRLSEIDWRVVQLMYGKKITPGLTSDRVKALLPGIT